MRRLIFYRDCIYFVCIRTAILYRGTRLQGSQCITATPSRNNNLGVNGKFSVGYCNSRVEVENSLCGGVIRRTNRNTRIVTQILWYFEREPLAPMKCRVRPPYGVANYIFRKIGTPKSATFFLFVFAYFYFHLLLTV